MRTTTALICSVLALTGCQNKTSTTTPSAPQAPAAAEVVGTYRREPLVMAFYRSQILRDQLNALRAERDAAIAKGDQEAAAAIEAKGAAIQEVAHQQLWGGAPLDSIMTVLASSLADVSAQLGVTTFVEDTDKLPAGTRTLDATDALVRLLPPAPLPAAKAGR